MSSTASGQAGSAKPGSAKSGSAQQISRIAYLRDARGRALSDADLGPEDVVIVDPEQVRRLREELEACGFHVSVTGAATLVLSGRPEQFQQVFRIGNDVSSARTVHRSLPDPWQGRIAALGAAMQHQYFP